MLSCMNKKGKYVYEWPRPMVTTDAVIFAVTPDATKLLLVKRGHDPYKGKWAIPGGFINIDEELEDAVARELQEETGLTGIRLEQMHTFGTCGQTPAADKSPSFIWALSKKDSTA